MHSQSIKVNSLVGFHHFLDFGSTPYVEMAVCMYHSVEHGLLPYAHIGSILGK